MIKDTSNKAHALFCKVQYTVYLAMYMVQMQLRIIAIYNAMHTVVKAVAKIMIKDYVCLKHFIIIMDTNTLVCCTSFLAADKQPCLDQATWLLLKSIPICNSLLSSYVYRYGMYLEHT